MKILIAEDDLVQQQIAYTCLEKLGYECILAANGLEAIELFQKHNPDIILMDVTMPEMDGFTAVEKIRQIESEWVPIIFLSGSDSPESIVRGINAGGDDYIAKPLHPEIVAAKIQALDRINEMRLRLKVQAQELKSSKEELQRASEELKILHEQMSHQATHDALTGLSNRAFFESVLEKSIAIAKRSNDNLFLLFLDLDGFKNINDNLGHFEGDEILKVVAARLKECIRSSDVLARYGGDEFVVMLTNVKNAMQAAYVAECIIKAIAKPIILDFKRHQVSMSIGISMMPNDSDTVSSLIECADTAMYAAKEHGKNTYQFFTKPLSGQPLNNDDC